MRPEVKKIAPEAIEAESFRIIEAELGPTSFRPDEFALVRRVIHATGDFAFAENLRFHPGAIAAGLEAIRAGRDILVDVNMVKAGVNAALLARWGGRVVCSIGEPAIAQAARAAGSTRAEAAVGAELSERVGIVAVGNAPTALLKVMQLIAESRWRPGMVIGVPVGFVNAAESKALLAGQDYPFITSLGRKGGSPVAAALVNGLLRLAER